MLNQSIQYQRGIGLIEVLVALLLLAVAVLGFSAMQMRAVKATDETLVRADALVAIRNVSENLRLQPTQAQKDAYRTAINNGLGTAADPAAYAAQIPATVNPDCSKTACNQQQQIDYTANRAMRLAADNQMMLNAIDCPDMGAAELRRVCLIASWGTTRPVAGNNNNDCISTTGTYNRSASCIVMETY